MAGWVSIEEVLRAHSAELTEAAARLAVTVEARPDSCPRGHPRTGRCPDCAKLRRQHRAEDRCPRGHDLTQPGAVDVLREPSGAVRRRCSACRRRSNQLYRAHRAAREAGHATR